MFSLFEIYKIMVLKENNTKSSNTIAKGNQFGEITFDLEAALVGIEAVYEIRTGVTYNDQDSWSEHVAHPTLAFFHNIIPKQVGKSLELIQVPYVTYNDVSVGIDGFFTYNGWILESVILEVVKSKDGKSTNPQFYLIVVNLDQF